MLNFRDANVDGRNPAPPVMYKHPVINGISYQPQLVMAGFQPSTEVPICCLSSQQIRNHPTSVFFDLTGPCLSCYSMGPSTCVGVTEGCRWIHGIFGPESFLISSWCFRIYIIHHMFFTWGGCWVLDCSSNCWDIIHIYREIHPNI